jgi:hypothetical protein
MTPKLVSSRVAATRLVGATVLKWLALPDAQGAAWPPKWQMLKPAQTNRVSAGDRILPVVHRRRPDNVSLCTRPCRNGLGGFPDRLRGPTVTVA